MLLLLAACGTPGASPSTTRPTTAAAPAPPVEPGPALGAACDGARLLANPADLAARGPWPVGARTVRVSGLTLEVWYPARPGSERGVPPVRYDLRTAMPPAEAAKIPDADNAWLGCDCARDLPLDEAHGPYPAVVFLHGAASFRAQSAFLMTHWASRGFVVVAPDVPGVGLAASLGQVEDVPTEPVAALVLDALAAPPAPDDPLAFVRGALGPGRALAGHSLGSMMHALLERPDVSVRIALAGFASPDGVASWLVVAGDHDRIAYAPDMIDRFAAQPAPSRLAVLHGAGHLAFSDLCTVGADRGGALAIAQRHGVTVPPIVAQLATDGCLPSDAPFTTTAPLLRALTAGVLEERLRCDPAATASIPLLAVPALTLVEHVAPP